MKTIADNISHIKCKISIYIKLIKKRYTVETFAIFVIAVLGVISGLLSQGMCIKIMWNWFVQPLGMPPIFFWQAIGLNLFIALFKPNKKDEETQSKTLKEQIMVF